VVGVGVGVGVTADVPVKVMLGLLLLESVTVKLPVSSCTVKVSVPAFCELTLKEACPFCALIVTGAEEPFTVRLESLEVCASVKLSDETSLWLQSFMSTVSVTVEPVAAEMGDAGETSEYQKLGLLYFL